MTPKNISEKKRIVAEAIARDQQRRATQLEFIRGGRIDLFTDNPTLGLETFDPKLAKIAKVSAKETELNNYNSADYFKDYSSFSANPEADAQIKADRAMNKENYTKILLPGLTKTGIVAEGKQQVSAASQDASVYTNSIRVTKQAEESINPWAVEVTPRSGSGYFMDDADGFSFTAKESESSSSSSSSVSSSEEGEDSDEYAYDSTSSDYDTYSSSDTDGESESESDSVLPIEKPKLAKKKDVSVPLEEVHSVSDPEVSDMCDSTTPSAGESSDYEKYETMSSGASVSEEEEMSNNLELDEEAFADPTPKLSNKLKHLAPPILEDLSNKFTSPSGDLKLSKENDCELEADLYVNSSNEIKPLFEVGKLDANEGSEESEIKQRKVDITKFAGQDYLDLLLGDDGHLRFKDIEFVHVNSMPIASEPVQLSQPQDSLNSIQTKEDDGNKGGLVYDNDYVHGFGRVYDFGSQVVNRLPQFDYKKLDAEKFGNKDKMINGDFDLTDAMVEDEYKNPKEKHLELDDEMFVIGDSIEDNHETILQLEKRLKTLNTLIEGCDDDEDMSFKINRKALQLHKERTAPMKVGLEQDESRSMSRSKKGSTLGRKLSKFFRSDKKNKRSVANKNMNTSGAEEKPWHESLKELEYYAKRNLRDDLLKKGVVFKDL